MALPAAHVRPTTGAATLALAVLLGIGSGAGAFAPGASASDQGAGATTSTEPRPEPVASDFGPDCRQNPNAVAAADELMAGTLRLSRHRPTRLPKNPAWSEDPFNDRNWEFQYHSLRFVWDLIEAWRRTGDRAYRDRGLFLLHDWVRDNPPGAGRSAFSWNDHSTAIRTFVIACAAVVAPKKSWIRAALRSHGAVLADPGFYVGHGNHALNQSRGLLAAGCLLERRDWQRLAAERIAGLLAESVDAEGVTNEQSTYYQFYNLQAYQAAAERLTACGMTVPKAFRRLDRMTELLTHATLPDGTYAPLGDTSHAPAAVIPGTSAAYAATAGRKGPKPPSRFAIFDAGFVFGRTGWGSTRDFEDEVAWSARFGPGRAFHGHLDHGSVTLYGYGQRLVDDPGLFTLNNNQWRAFAVSRAAHNVITVDGVRYAAGSRATASAVHSKPTHDDITIHDPGYQGVSLDRRVVFSHGLGWLLVDDRAVSTRTRTYRQLWHLIPGADPVVDGTAVRSRQCGGNVVIVQLRAPDRVRVVRGRRGPLQGWYSTSLNKWRKSPTIEVVQSGRSVRYVTLLVPIARADSTVEVRSVAVDGSAIRFTLTVDRRRERVKIGPRTVTVTTLRNLPVERRVAAADASCPAA